MKTQQDSELKLPSEADGAALLGTAAAATLLGVTPETLRNYVWLQSLAKNERAKRSLQEPPSKMPKPRRISGRLYWKAEAFRKWIKDREGIF